jgi:hypothetical protein
MRALVLSLCLIQASLCAVACDSKGRPAPAHSATGDAGAKPSEPTGLERPPGELARPPASGLPAELRPPR